jgi:putative ABC transport system substrate-binding protein
MLRPIFSILLLSLTFLTSAQGAEVVLLRSDDFEAYRETAEAVVANLKVPVAVYDLEGDRSTAFGVVARLKRTPPKVVIALGKKAAFAAHSKLADVPIVYGLVPNPERYGLVGPGLTGVRHDVAMDEILSYLRLFVPDAERIGMLIWQGNQNPKVKEAIQAGKDAGYNIRALRVGSAEDVPPAFMRLRRDIDVFWLVPDHFVVTPANFRFLRDETQRLNMPLIAYTEDLVRAGAPMAVGPDREAVGRQLAQLATAILEGADPNTLDIQDPESVRVVLNRATQDAIGLEIDEAMLGFVDEVLQGDGR